MQLLPTIENTIFHHFRRTIPILSLIKFPFQSVILQLVIMCVDDYEFRHFSARRQKICRKFVIINEDEVARTFYVNISQFQQNGEVALCKILIYLSTKGLVIQNKKFYLPKFSAIIEPFTYCKIIFEALDQTEILVKTYPGSKQTSEIFAENENNEMQYEEDNNEDNCFCRFEDVEEEPYMDIDNWKYPEDKAMNETMEEEMNVERMISELEERGSSSDNKEMIEEGGHKKMKESQRGIGQVIKAVKIWRELHESKRCNLTNAAKVVGISKKSLDDYFLVLRIGQIQGFDYASNMEGKMGDLRNYIRQKQIKITGKLGKNLECLKLIENFNLDQLVKDYQTSSATVF